MDEEIRQVEERLREAMLAGDVEALDRLIHDRLLFLGPDGSLATKQDDLASHRARAHHFTSLEVLELRTTRHGSTAVAVALVQMAGVAQGQPFGGKFRYLRTWLHEDGRWQIVGGAVMAAAG